MVAKRELRFVDDSDKSLVCTTWGRVAQDIEDLRAGHIVVVNEGFSCEDRHVYVVLKALYGLRQSGTAWNTELNRWLAERGYHRSLTESCLYYLFEGDVIMLDLVYFGDIMVATNDEKSKCKLFEDLDDASYGMGGTVEYSRIN
ncbi:hypothetical protein JG688_00013349 [Phytophthora aleatoria]|uniref:Reverse transcriptase Ty1/copia-type domain-containing protein n=1 Tax=Phytophthora aleatoria TaxID=2496075 RepID=A0A8J5J0W9_9STRA|nr:hypothetical protein JG688_00013349 [Phytophthora aleatoria]